MAKWHPANESPQPEPWFVRALKKIDRDLNVVWGMERYLRAEWAIERKMPPERYFAAYAAVLSDDGPRFVDQPVFDMEQPIRDKQGDIVGYTQVGTRLYDLAPEYEWVAFRPSLDQTLLDLIQKLYWERDHPEETAAANAAEKSAKAAEQKAKRIEGAISGIDEALLETRKIVQFGAGPTRNEPVN